VSGKKDTENIPHKIIQKELQKVRKEKLDKI